MLIEINALKEEIPAIGSLSTSKLCEELAMLGFPVDDVIQDGLTSVLEVDVTANRGDAQSHRGLARDLAAKLAVTLKPIAYRQLTEANPMINIELAAGDLAPLYATALVTLKPINNIATPDTVEAFLTRMHVGIKELPAVDASNEILHRYGQPTHVFDFDLIKGDVEVRLAKDGETIVTMDMVERKLTCSDLVIADATGPIAMAGLMGGNSTRVTANTRRILVESAYFDPHTIRAMVYRHNLHTDASHRFGRGTDPGLAIVARDLLVNKLQDWSGAQLQAAWTLGSYASNKAAVAMSWALLDRIVGYHIDRCEAIGILKRLGCNVDEQIDQLVITAPDWRHDLNIANDFVEEIIRIKGYNTIATSLPPLDSIPMAMPLEYTKRRQLAARLANLGFFQIVTMGFSSPKNNYHGYHIGDQPELRTISNPLGEEYSVMRGTLLYDLAKVARLNLERGAKEVKLFEIAPVFKAYAGKAILEAWNLGLIWCGESGGNDPLSSSRNMGSQEGKSFLIGILQSIGVTSAAIKDFNNWPVVEDKGDAKVCLGWHFEITIADIPDKNQQILPLFTPFSKFPVVERDLSLLVDLEQPYSVLRDAIVTALNNVNAPLQNIKCVDVFRHKTLAVGKQAWLLRLCFQAMDYTLTKEAIDHWMNLALDAANKLGAELRS